MRGRAYSTVGIGALLYGPVQAAESGWSSPVTVASLTNAALHGVDQQDAGAVSG